MQGSWAAINKDGGFTELDRNEVWAQLDHLVSVVKTVFNCDSVGLGPTASWLEVSDVGVGLLFIQRKTPDKLFVLRCRCRCFYIHDLVVRPILKSRHVSCYLLVVDVVVFGDVLSDDKRTVIEIGDLACCVGDVCLEFSVKSFFINLPINCFECDFCDCTS